MARQQRSWPRQPAQALPGKRAVAVGLPPTVRPAGRLAHPVPEPALAVLAARAARQPPAKRVWAQSEDRSRPQQAPPAAQHWSGRPRPDPQPQTAAWREPAQPPEPARNTVPAVSVWPVPAAGGAVVVETAAGTSRSRLAVQGPDAPVFPFQNPCSQRTRPGSKPAGLTR